MGRIVVTEFLTLDGVMEAPGGEPTHPHTGWVLDFPDPRQMQYKLDEVLEADALLIGRVTYESFAGAWPQRDDPQGFAAKMNAMPKYVVSSTLRDPEWQNTTVIGADVPWAVEALRQRVDGMILVAGSRTLVQALMEHDLVDEYRLMVFPVSVGGGGRLFPDTRQKLAFDLASTQVLDSGTVILHYRPRRAAAGGDQARSEAAVSGS